MPRALALCCLLLFFGSGESRSQTAAAPAPAPKLAQHVTDTTGTLSAGQIAELEQRLEQDPELAQAFAALTPGRRRSHILHVSGAKQSDTRARRVERCVPEILAGRGFNER